MPETPDFEKIAHGICARFVAYSSEDVRGIGDQLRLIWNTRGAVDIAAIEHSLASQMGATASGPYLKNLGRELKNLDR